MSVYLNQRQKTYRYDFTYQGQRHTQAGFRTKREALAAEAARKEELTNPEEAQPREPQNPRSTQPPQTTQTDMDFLELVNRRLDHVKAYHSHSHYVQQRDMARHWVRRWNGMKAAEISREMLESFILERSKVSKLVANKELRCLRALFNFAIDREYLEKNPTKLLKFLPLEKKERYVPPAEDLEKVISVAEGDQKDYLLVLRETMGRMGEINRLEWKDIDIQRRTVTLYTRKKKGGHLTPRKIPMTGCLMEILERRSRERDQKIPWVFGCRYWDRRKKAWTVAPFQDRKNMMRKLCAKAGVKYFRFHPIRHFGASTLDMNNVPLGAIQKILGHENRSTTEIYLHTIGSVERDAMEVFEAAMQKVSHRVSHQ